MKVTVPFVESESELVHCSSSFTILFYSKHVFCVPHFLSKIVCYKNRPTRAIAGIREAIKIYYAANINGKPL